MQVQSIELAHVQRASNARSLEKKAVDGIAASMREIGQITPVVVVARDIAVHGVMVPGFLLIAGNHRVEAARSIAWTHIDARVVTGSSLENELIEIDENLCRAELTAAQRASHIKRRKQIWEALHPAEPQRVADLERQRGSETGGASCATSQPDDCLPDGRRKGPQHQKEFAASTAEVTGESKATINRQLAVADALGDDLGKVEGTSLDKGVELQALAKLPEQDRKDLIDRAAAGEKVSAREPIRPAAAVSLVARLASLINRSVGEIPSSLGYRSVDALAQALQRSDYSQQDSDVLASAIERLDALTLAVGEAMITAEAAE